MKDIEELTKNIEKYNNVIIQQKFPSKKNTVAYATIDEKPRILKWFVPGFKKQMKNEHTVLTNGSSKLNIPFPYEIDEENNVLVMSYIMGENLCDIINNDKTSYPEKERLMILLSEWFAQFHTHFKTPEEFRIRGDSNLRNFILSDQIWGVDLEESRKGKPEEDIARICASILTTDPMFTDEKFKLCQKLIESYSKQVKWNLVKINEEIAYSLLEKIQWRPDEEENLRNYAQKIRKQGLR